MLSTVSLDSKIFCEEKAGGGEMSGIILAEEYEGGKIPFLLLLHFEEQV